MPSSGPLGAIPWRTDTVPFTRQPMQDFADSGTDVVVLMVAAQSAKTETIFNVLNWHFRTRPKPCMYIAPTEKLCRTLSRDRLDSMLRSNSDLWPLVDKRFAKPGSMERWINGARLGMAWAGSAVELVSHPVHTVFVDERGVMDDISSVSSSSDPVRQAKARTKNYKGAKVGVFSTPTDEESCPTYRWWRQGTKMRWCWQCKHCGNWFAPRSADMRYPHKAEYETVRQEAYIECPQCQGAIRDADRCSWNADGSVTWHIEQKYIPHVLDEDGRTTIAPDVTVMNRVKSYWVTGYCTPFVTIGEVAEELTRASREGTPEDVQSVVNQYCGELFVVEGERPPWKAVLNRTYRELDDSKVQLVTAGVDVQQDSLYVVVRGWGYLSESWLLDWEQIRGASEYDNVWLALGTVLERTYCGRSVALTLVDSGYQTSQVYEMCRRHPGWLPSKGRASGRPFDDSTIDEWPSGRPMKGSIKLWTFNADVWKQWLYARIGADRDSEQAGAWWVPEGISEEYCQQVTNEKCITLVNGKRRWTPTGNAQNHLLDAEINATVAAHVCNVRALAPPRQPDAEPPEPPRRDPSLQRQSAW